MNVTFVVSYEDKYWRDVVVNIELDDGTKYCRSVVYSTVNAVVAESSWYHRSNGLSGDFCSLSAESVPDDVKQIYAQHVTVAKIMARGDDL